MSHFLRSTSASKARSLNVPVILGLVVAVSLSVGFRKMPHLSGTEVMQQVEDRYQVDSEIDLVRMVTMDNEGNTEIRQLISLVAVDDSDNYRYLVRVLEPDDVRGVTLLTLDGNEGMEQWFYLPGLGEARQLKGGARGGSFLGSDFSYDDMRRETLAEHDYHRLQDDTVEGRSVYQILSAPKGADIRRIADYAHRILSVDKEDFTVLKIDFFDEGRRLIKTFQAYDYNSSQVEGESLRPRRAVMTNHTHGTTTVMTLQKSRLNMPVPDAFFSLDSLGSEGGVHEEDLLAILSDKTGGD